MLLVRSYGSESWLAAVRTGPALAVLMAVRCCAPFLYSNCTPANGGPATLLDARAPRAVHGHMLKRGGHLVYIESGALGGTRLGLSCVSSSSWSAGADAAV